MTPEKSQDPPPSRRTVRSFVIRGGRQTAAQQRAMDELWPSYGVEFSEQPADLDRLFGRQAPRMLEIGFGAGEALLAFTQAHPELDCIGVEVHKPGVGHLLLGAEAAGLKNLRVICHDAVEVLQQQLAPGSIQLIHIFFPDPWHKKRHHKRRLIQPEFVELLARVLAVGGTLRLATDWEHYALQMREVIDASAAFANDAPETGFVARSEERPLTRFERRGQRLGHGVWDLSYTRVSSPSQ
ncbi:tRNA (guanine-N(7)-)-methyltransferase [Steroidobacter agaridevorans]|uniref:tRNA (guanine-N(7)-)-methyltransferase n=1 Tax=Steroidobacter agaridevorans TaxID=2695856 RepID=A0A829YDY5_9GAMM|nr:tRNA (guanosine(46)-N7)-methyltransferase TrmB [Steroidobacter agaridevorans]GFE80892.1 tRNA (guanine-N(7)-)-methyltransferase [Steroidobacter agaridevorans]GFE89224.1 tRNA (guanine-N(7)-)-methyltransferase [Steroidobacter agaridevorans]